MRSLVVWRGHTRPIIAIGRRILRTVFFMLERRRNHRDAATGHAALSVQGKAPRWINPLTKFGFIAPASARSAVPASP